MFAQRVRAQNSRSGAHKKALSSVSMRAVWKNPLWLLPKAGFRVIKHCHAHRIKNDRADWHYL